MDYDINEIPFENDPFPQGNAAQTVLELDLPASRDSL